MSSKHGIGQVVFSSIVQGILTGKYKGNTIPDDSRASYAEINNFRNKGSVPQ